MVLNEMTSNPLTIEPLAMRPARSYNQWSRLFRPAMLFLGVLALTALTSENDIVAAAGLAFAVIALGARALADKPQKATDEDIAEAVWPTETKPRFALSANRGRRTRRAQKPVGIQLDEIERQFRDGDISDEERLTRRDQVITAGK